MNQTYTDLFNPKRTSQSEPIPGKEQVKNYAGGYVFKVDKWTALDRFLILGTDSPTYYANAQTLTQKAAQGVMSLIAEDGVRVVNRVVEISEAGRAYKNDPALYVLALAISIGDNETRALVADVLPRVARIGTHLFTFVGYATSMRGWGNVLKRAVQNWYYSKNADKLAYQISKYQQRNVGGKFDASHRNILRVAHPEFQSPEKEAVYRWAVGADYGERSIVDRSGEVDRYYEGVEDYVLDYMKAVDAVKTASEKEAISLITNFNLPREVLPTELLKSPAVWAALLQPGADKFMPLNAMIRNLATMTRIGLLNSTSSATRVVVSRLTDGEALLKSRVHPVQVLNAMLTYKSGGGYRSSHTWTPVRQIVDALDAAFYASFGNVEPTGKTRMFALDMSGSMGGPDLMGVPGLSPRVASAAMSMVAARTENTYLITGFTNAGGGSRWGKSGIEELAISPRQRLDDVCTTINRYDWGGTDCALPMKYALDNGIEVDSFEVYTDNETWAGSEHPIQALDRYQKAVNPNAKLVVVGMTATEFSIADPSRSDNLDVVGFDTATPNVVSDFIRGI